MVSVGVDKSFCQEPPFRQKKQTSLGWTNKLYEPLSWDVKPHFSGLFPSIFWFLLYLVLQLSNFIAHQNHALGLKRTIWFVHFIEESFTNIFRVAVVMRPLGVQLQKPHGPTRTLQRCHLCSEPTWRNPRRAPVCLCVTSWEWEDGHWAQNLSFTPKIVSGI